MSRDSWPWSAGSRPGIHWSLSWIFGCRRHTPAKVWWPQPNCAPGIRPWGVLVLSQYIEAHYAMQLIGDDARGVGYLLKDRVGDVAELASAVRRIGRGGSAIDPEVISQLVGRRRLSRPIDQLTERERQVLVLMAEGHSNQAICGRLSLSGKTVETHVRSIFANLKLPATNEHHRR